MSRIIVKCSGCSTKYKLRGELAGKKVVCRNCQRPIPVKAPAPDSDAVEIDEFEEEDDFADAFATPPASVKARKPAARLGTPKPARKKSAAKRVVKTGDADGPSANRMMIGMVGGALLVLVALAALIVPRVLARARAASQVEAPAAFFQYNDPGAAIWLECPEGWEVTKGGGNGGVPGWVKIKWNKVNVSIRDSHTGSAIGDIAGSTKVEVSDDPEMRPVHVVHMFRLRQLQIDNPGYEETEPEIFTTKMGEARLAEFTKPTTFGQTVGYRCTLPPRMNQYTVTCECTPHEFEVLKDTFRRMIASCRRGPG